MESKETQELTFRALALRQSEWLTLETSALESLYGRQFTFSYQTFVSTPHRHSAVVYF